MNEETFLELFLLKKNKYLFIIQNNNYYYKILNTPINVDKFM